MSRSDTDAMLPPPFQPPSEGGTVSHQHLRVCFGQRCHLPTNVLIVCVVILVPLAYLTCYNGSRCSTAYCSGCGYVLVSISSPPPTTTHMGERASVCVVDIQAYVPAAQQRRTVRLVRLVRLVPLKACRTATSNQRMGSPCRWPSNGQLVRGSICTLLI